MRVIAGSARGTRLFVPRTEVRPTMDRVKAAIFSALGERIGGARVLDLFAGCGALGIEALSRGCAQAVFVEKDAQAVETIRRNLAKTRFPSTVLCMDVFDFLNRRAEPNACDVIFADPPYAKAVGETDCGALLLASQPLHRAAAEDAIFVLEKLPGSEVPPHPGWDLIWERRYGATAVALFRSSSGGVME